MVNYFNRLIINICVILLFVAGTAIAQTGPGGISGSNNQLWLKSTEGLTLNGSTVSAWADQSGNGHSVVQSTASEQPLLVTNEMNGKPVIRFDGVDDFLFTGGLALSLQANRHVYVVFKTSTTQNGKVVLSFPEGLLGINGFDIGLSSSGIYSYARTSALFASLSSTNLTYNDDNARIVHAAFNAGLLLGEHQLAIDGTLSDDANNSGPLLINVINQFFLGCFSGVFGNFAEVDIAEVIIYNSFLDDMEKLLIENYLAACYNISIANDIYASTTHTLDVAGIGREGGDVNTEAHSAGLVLLENGAANTNGDYLVAGHNLAGNTVVTDNLPSGVAQRWNREWFFDKSGVPDGADLKIGFDFSDGGFAETPGTPANYRLLRRVNTSSNFVAVTTNAVSVVSDRVIFDVSEDNVEDENYYTVGASESDEPLPVFLDGFSATVSGNHINLQWATESEVNNQYFIVERSTDDMNYQTIAQIPGQGTSNQRSAYSYSDYQVAPNQQYYYRLADQNFNGHLTYHPSIAVFVPNGSNEYDAAALQGFHLSDNYPNPFNPATFIDYQLMRANRVFLAVYNSLGQLVKILVEADQEPGAYTVQWDGHDSAGRKMPSGIYYYRLQLDRISETRKMLLME